MRDLVAEIEEREISARIKKARKEAGLTQDKMAQLLEVIPRSVQNYESGRVPWNMLNTIAKITGKTPEWLLHGDAPDLMGAMNGDREHLEVKLDRIEAKLDRLIARLAIEDESAPAAPGRPPLPSVSTPPPKQKRSRPAQTQPQAPKRKSA